MRTHLGDGVYIEHTGTMYRIWTDRDDRRHEIYLERAVMANLLAYVIAQPWSVSGEVCVSKEEQRK